MTCLNAFEEKNFEKVRKDEKVRKINQKNIVMNKGFVKNSVNHANLDLKVVMDLSIINIGGCNNLPSREVN